MSLDFVLNLFCFFLCLIIFLFVNHSLKHTAKQKKIIIKTFQLSSSKFYKQQQKTLINFCRLANPCDGCAAPYGFRNHMSLDIKTDQFSVSCCCWKQKQRKIAQIVAIQHIFIRTQGMGPIYVMSFFVSIPFILILFYFFSFCI